MVRSTHDAISYVSDDRNQAGIEIHSGRNRIVRRIFEHLGYRVTKLDRVYFAGLTKKNLPRGRWRYLSQEGELSPHGSFRIIIKMPRDSGSPGTARTTSLQIMEK